jgi:hypothetical protein
MVGISGFDMPDTGKGRQIQVFPRAAAIYPLLTTKSMVYSTISCLDKFEPCRKGWLYENIIMLPAISTTLL